MLLALLLCAVSAGQVIAGSEEGDSQQLQDPSESGSGVELKSERTATSETFRLPDGSRETRIYESPIHYRGADGEWQPIGDRLEEVEGGGLSNGSNEFDVELPAHLGTDPVRLSAGEEWISSEPVGPVTEAVELEGATASYESQDGAASFEFSGLANGLKEDIVIADSSGPSTFHFALDASQGLSPNLVEGGAIAFRDGNDEPVFVLPAPVVSDSGSRQPAPSGTARYELLPQGDGWRLDVVVDPQWLSDPERVWPARIDPTVTLPGPSLDCAIFNGPYAESNLCASKGWPLLGAFAKYQSSGKDEYARSLLKFDLSSIPANAYVGAANLGLYAPVAASNTSGVQVRRVTKTWTSALSWFRYDATNKWALQGGDWASEGTEVTTASRGSQAGWWEFSETGLADLVRKWHSGSIANQGVLVMLKDELTRQCGPSLCPERKVEFNSSAAADSNKRPYLKVTYYPPAPKGSKMSSPGEGTRSARRFKLSAAWNHQGVTGVYFQYQDPTKGWVDIPAAKVTDKDNKVVEWPVPTEGAHQSEPLYWDALETPQYPPNVLKGQIRAVLVGAVGSEGYTEAVNVVLDRNTGGTKDATAAVGPGSVNLLTGNYTMSRTDVSIPGFGSALEFTRTHSSKDTGIEEKGVLGKGWKPGVAVEAAGGAEWRKVTIVTPSQEEQEEGLGKYAILADLEGYEYAFEEGPGESFISPPDVTGWLLTRVSPTRLAFTDPDGNRTTFENSSGGAEYLPVSITQAGGSTNSTLMVYDLIGPNRRLSKIIAPYAADLPGGCNESNANKQLGCRSLSFSYLPATTWGAPASMGDRLAAITYHGSPNEFSLQNWTVAKYTYNSDGRLIEQWDPRISPELKEGYEYTSGGQVKTLKVPGEAWWYFDYGTFQEEKASGRLLKVNRGMPNYESLFAQTTIAYGVPVSGAGAPYDMSPGAVGQWGQEDLPTDATAIFPPDQVPSSPPSSYSRATVHYMDAEGQQVNTATPSGAGTTAPSITTAETDEHGNAVRELSAQNRLRALAAGSESVKRSKELDTKRTYNADGTEMQEEWGPLHETRLVESGVTVPARTHTTIHYDDDGKAPPPPAGTPQYHLPTRVTIAASTGKGTDADARITETKYDWALRKPTETIVDPFGLNLRTRIAYDKESGLPTERSLPAEPEGKDARTTKTIYYTSGGASPDPDCRNKPTLANLPCKVLPAAQPKAEGYPELLVTKYASYNALGQPLEVVQSPGGGSSSTRKTITTYDAAGRPTSTKQEGGGVSLPATETLYNPSTGRMETQRFACEKECASFDSQATTTTYDGLGRVFSYEDADGNTSTFSYDLLNRPVSIYDGKGTQTFSYDANSGLLVKLQDSAAGTFTASYDADGNITQRGLPNGLTATATYDETGAPVHLSYVKTLNCVTECTWLDFDVEESIHGQRLSHTSNLSSQQYSYDNAGRLTLVKDTPKGGSCTTREYSYDANSNRKSLVTREPGIGGACDTTSAGKTQSYIYDTGDRLLGAELSYDNFGRITSLPKAFSGGGTLTSTYYSNDLIRSQAQDGITNTYDLDASLRQRRRVQSGSKSGTEIYHYAGGSDSPAWIDRGSSWSRSIGGIGGSLAAIQDSATGTTLQLTNLHGDIVATASLSTEATKPLATFEFDEFGNPKGTTPGKYGWLGGKSRRTELPSGVIQMGVRSYVPAMGRFLSPDPVLGGSANAYEYAAGDPVNNFDLTGEKCSGKKSCAKALSKAKERVRKSIARVRALVREKRAESNRRSMMSLPKLPWEDEVKEALNKATSFLKAADEATSCSDAGAIATGGGFLIEQRAGRVAEAGKKIQGGLGMVGRRLGILGVVLSGAGIFGLC